MPLVLAIGILLCSIPTIGTADDRPNKPYNEVRTMWFMGAWYIKLLIWVMIVSIVIIFFMGASGGDEP